MRANAAPYVELPEADGNLREHGSGTKLPPGFDVPGENRQHKVLNYHIPALRKNVSASIKRSGSDIFCVSCKNEHHFNGAEPICIILSDQNFPPLLPTDSNMCCVILRLEDCFLSEQPGILKE
jgi:hypothetical protein